MTNLDSIQQALNTTHYSAHDLICGCGNPDCLWLERAATLWVVFRINEDLEPILDTAMGFDSQVSALEYSALMNAGQGVYITLAPEGVYEFIETTFEEDPEFRDHLITSAKQVIADYIRQMEWATIEGDASFQLKQVSRPGPNLTDEVRHAITILTNNNIQKGI
jgi:hypothetical protein